MSLQYNVEHDLQAFAVQASESPVERVKSPVPQVIGDFLSTFRYSQGDQLAQPSWMRLVGHEYRSQSPERQKEVQNALPAIGKIVLGLHAPKRHQSVYEDERAKQMAIHGRKFIRTIGSTPLMPRAVDHALVIEAMVSKDRKYQQVERNSTRHTDPHQSHMREYVLERNDTGSTTYNDILDRLHTRTFRWGLPLRAGILRARWERNHPGQHFFPDSYAAIYDQRATKLARGRNAAGMILGKLLVKK